MQLKKNSLLTIIIGFFVILFTTTLQFSNNLKWLENKTYDSRIKQTSKYFEPYDDIVLVLVDQQSLKWAEQELGWGWPWPRESYGKIVKFFNRCNVSSITFDMTYSEKSIYGTEDDIAYAKEIESCGKVIQTVFYASNKSEEGTFPIDVIKEASAIIATDQSLLDEDGVIRRARFYSSSLQKEPSLAVASLKLANEMPDEDSIPKAKYGKKGESEQGMYVRFMDSLDRYHPYSAKTILQSEYAIEKAEEEGIDYEPTEDLLDTDCFEDMYIFFGLFSTGLFDICATPMGTNYPGVGVHIAMLDTILQENYLSDISDSLTVFLIILFAFIGIALTIVLGQKSRIFGFRILFLAITSTLYLALSYYLFYKGTIIPIVSPLLALGLAFICSSTKIYLTEGKQKKYLKSAFSQYLSPAVINNLIDNPKALKLGGEEREITAYFSDVQGFTSISENLNPTELTNLLNTYLSAMTDIILSYGGTIDKYEGDAIIAFWNAPTNQPDHAKRALEASLACQQKLIEMQEELVAVAGKPFKQRIGLNTGRAVVGNMGSKQRFDYTMLGDTVNLASRLEGINKQFGTYTMCSKATMENAIEHGCELSFRKLSNIAVVGRKQGVEIFEILTKEENEKRADDFVNFNVGYDLFVKGNFEEAIKIFEKTAEKDPAAKKYIEKCKNLIKNPPEKWDGVLRATEK